MLKIVVRRAVVNTSMCRVVPKDIARVRFRLGLRLRCSSPGSGRNRITDQRTVQLHAQHGLQSPTNIEDLVTSEKQRTGADWLTVHR